MGKPRKNIVGQRFNRLVAIECVGATNGRAIWRMLCDCGNYTNVSLQKLQQGHTQSCGCLLASLKLSKGLGSAKALYRRYQYAANRDNRQFDLTFDLFLTITQQLCYYCHAHPKLTVYPDRSIKLGYIRPNGNYVFNGIDRKNNDLGYTVDNCVSCCRTCNIAKAQMTAQEYIDHCKTVAKLH